MKIRRDIKMFNDHYAKRGKAMWCMIYAFFLVHMLLFGGLGFFMAYHNTRPAGALLFMSGGIAILAYMIFYLLIFGCDTVKWMFINAALGLAGIYTQIGWLLSWFGKDIHDYPLRNHVVPFIYFVLYTFLLRQAVLDMAGARKDKKKQKRVEYGYVTVLTAYYVISYWLTKQ